MGRYHVTSHKRYDNGHRNGHITMKSHGDCGR